MRIIVDSRRQYRHDKVKQSPEGAEQELDLQPRNLVEFLNYMEQIEAQEDAGEPERYHRYPAEEGAFWRIVLIRELNADETEETADLETPKFLMLLYENVCLRRHISENQSEVNNTTILLNNTYWHNIYGVYVDTECD